MGHPDNDKETRLPGRPVSRRRFLETVGALTAGALLAHCAPKSTSEVAAPQTVAPTPRPIAKSSKVAIAKADSYDRKVIEQTLTDMLDGLGGLSDIVRPGDRVLIKTNLTGGTSSRTPSGYTAMETFVTHPEVVRALGAAVRDAGAKEVFIVESVYEWDSYRLWGYEDIAGGIDAQLIDLNGTDPYGDYVDHAVPGGGEIYTAYKFNRLLEETHVFMSVAKMKCHLTAGVTHAMKNLVGLVPARFYKLTQNVSHRSAFHGPDEASAGYRIPRIIVELNKARPIHFALIDGIKTTEGGEGPWVNGMAPISPGVLFAGKNALATDAVATAAQGFDPTAASMTSPFIRCDNYLTLAAEAGLGTNRLDEIEVVGASIDDVRYPFKPCQ